jgi:maternal-effect protein exuperantia
MSPVGNSSLVKEGRYHIVTWDLDTTGRRLIDEICQVAGFYKNGSEEFTYSQYVMPHKNPNPGARRSFGIKVTSMGRYRMLKDVETGRILKTKSEVSALQDFITWLKEAQVKTQSDGIILVSHEPARKVLIPLFLEAIRRYDLFGAFSDVVVAFANSVKVVEQFADSDKVTSFSMRSLCKTLLNNTNPATTSACDRAKVLVEILSKVVSKDNSEDLDDAKILSVATSVKVEQEEVQNLKSVLGTQGTLRPIFEGQLKQKRAVREHAISLRKLVAEAGLQYSDLAQIYENSQESRHETLKARIEEASDKEVEDLVHLLDKHFITGANTANANGDAK